MSSESNAVGRGQQEAHDDDGKPGIDAARRVAAGQSVAVADGGDHFALLDEATGEVGVFHFDGWEGVFTDDVDIHGHQVWSTRKADLVGR